MRVYISRYSHGTMNNEKLQMKNVTKSKTKNGNEEFVVCTDLGTRPV